MPKIDDIVKEIKKSIEDYSQLKRGYPNAQKFLEAFVENVRKVAPPDPMDAEKSREFAMNRAFDIPGGLAATFIGPKATTWNADKAAKAAKLLDEGADPAQVWKEYLIGRMPDGKLFSEIDDSGAIINKNTSPQKVLDVIQHDDLFKNYDDLERIKYGKIIDNSSKASYQPENINAWGDLIPEEVLINEKKLNKKDLKSNVLHELQHSIQYREDFPVGSNLKDAKQQIEQSNRLIHKEKQRIIDEYGYKDNRLPLLDLQLVDENDTGSLLSFYKRSAGEAQARATQDRMNMNMQQRRDNYPLGGGMLSDIPLEQLIYRYK